MDSFEWNKIFGAVLGTVLIIATLNIVVGKMMAPHQSGKPGMEVAVAETPAGGGTTPEVETKPDWGTVIPVADVTAGEKVHQRCVQCHDFTKGGPNKIGPNLYGIMGNKHAHEPSFSYSPAMKALADKTWGYDEFYEFMRNPKGAIPGTKMAFAGLSKSPDRVNLIAYLRTLADSPIAIPAPNPVAPAAPADGATEPPAGELQAPPPGSTPETPATAPPAAPGTTAPSAAPSGAPAKPPAP
jgi:cytochrome c